MITNRKRNHMLGACLRWCLLWGRAGCPLQPLDPTAALSHCLSQAWTLRGEVGKGKDWLQGMGSESTQFRLVSEDWVALTRASRLHFIPSVPFHAAAAAAGFMETRPQAVGRGGGRDPRPEAARAPGQPTHLNQFADSCSLGRAQWGVGP